MKRIKILLGFIIAIAAIIVLLLVVAEERKIQEVMGEEQVATVEHYFGIKLPEQGRIATYEVNLPYDGYGSIFIEAELNEQDYEYIKETIEEMGYEKQDSVSDNYEYKVKLNRKLTEEYYNSKDQKIKRSIKLKDTRPTISRTTYSILLSDCKDGVFTIIFDGMKV